MSGPPLYDEDGEWWRPPEDGGEPLTDELIAEIVAQGFDEAVLRRDQKNPTARYYREWNILVVGLLDEDQSS